MASPFASTSRCVMQCAQSIRCRHSTGTLRRSCNAVATTSRHIHTAKATPTQPDTPSQRSSNATPSQEPDARHTDAILPSSMPPAAPLLSPAEADERIRQILLDRDGGPASVPTRAGKWDSEMGRDTARQMFRVLDQSRIAKPGSQHAAGEGESKHWSRRNY